MSTLTKLGNIVNKNPYSKNVIINGDFNIAQRGTSVNIPPGAIYGLDRWKVFNTTDATFTMDQFEGAPTFAQSGHMSKYSLEIDPSVADVTLGDNDYGLLAQSIEGYNIAPLVGKTVTLSFWLLATKTGTTCCKIINYGGGVEILKEFTISQSNQWEKYTWTFDLDATQTWNLDSGAGLGVNFSLGAGPNYQGAATETWSDFTYQATSNQVNHLDSASNVYRLSQVQLEEGNVATTFDSRSFTEELALCQRYYEKSYSQGTDPGTYTAGTSMGLVVAMGVTTRAPMTNVSFATEKRTVPAISIWDQLGNSNKVSDYSNNANQYTISSISGESTGRAGNYLQTTSAMGSVNVVFHWAADAEI